MKQNWWNSVYKQNHFVFKLGISILLVGFGLRLLFSQSETVIPNAIDYNVINTPGVEKDLKPNLDDFAESPKDLIQFHQKGKPFFFSFIFDVDLFVFLYWKWGLDLWVFCIFYLRLLI